MEIPPFFFDKIFDYEGSLVAETVRSIVKNNITI